MTEWLTLQSQTLQEQLSLWLGHVNPEATSQHQVQLLPTEGPLPVMDQESTLLLPWPQDLPPGEHLVKWPGTDS